MKICDWVLIFPVRPEYGSDMDRSAHHKKLVVLVSVLLCGSIQLYVIAWHSYGNFMFISGRVGLVSGQNV